MSSSLPKYCANTLLKPNTKTTPKAFARCKPRVYTLGTTIFTPPAELCKSSPTPSELCSCRLRFFPGYKPWAEICKPSEFKAKQFSQTRSGFKLKQFSRTPSEFKSKQFRIIWLASSLAHQIEMCFRRGRFWCWSSASASRLLETASLRMIGYVFDVMRRRTF